MVGSAGKASIAQQRMARSPRYPQQIALLCRWKYRTPRTRQGALRAT